MRRATVTFSGGLAITEFQSTLSMRRATPPCYLTTPRSIFQSTLSMRRATCSFQHFIPAKEVSIHALHEESDSNQQTMQLADMFQSTLSMRRATVAEHGERVTVTVSIHALHEESDLDDLEKQIGQYVSIHALHEESDERLGQNLLGSTSFNPRSP